MPLNDYVCSCGKTQEKFHKTISSVPDEVPCECGLSASRDRFPKLGYRRDHTVSGIEEKIAWREPFNGSYDIYG